jgi:hypothetical protein
MQQESVYTNPSGEKSLGDKAKDKLKQLQSGLTDWFMKPSAEPSSPTQYGGMCMSKKCKCTKYRVCAYCIKARRAKSAKAKKIAKAKKSTKAKKHTKARKGSKSTTKRRQ